jgi:hypothetical protein
MHQALHPEQQTPIVLANVVDEDKVLNTDPWGVPSKSAARRDKSREWDVSRQKWNLF